MLLKIIGIIYLIPLVILLVFFMVVLLWALYVPCISLVSVVVTDIINGIIFVIGNLLDKDTESLRQRVALYICRKFFLLDKYM